MEKTREQIIAEKTWTCPDCGEDVEPLVLDDGHVIKRRFCDCPAGQEKEEEVFGKAYLHRAQRKRWVGDSRLDPNLTFDNYEGVHKARAIGYVTSLLAGDEGWCWIHGPAGTHKRHLANAMGMLILNQSKQDPRVQYLDWAHFEREMRNSWDDSERSDYPHQFRQAQKAHLLIVSGAGKVSRNAWGVRQFVDLISYRSRGHKPTVFVSHLPFRDGSDSLYQVLRETGLRDVHLFLEEWTAIFEHEIMEQPNGLIIYTGR